jgi:hypothetical protein
MGPRWRRWAAVERLGFPRGKNWRCRTAALEGQIKRGEGIGASLASRDLERPVRRDDGAAGCRRRNSVAVVVVGRDRWGRDRDKG